MLCYFTIQVTRGGMSPKIVHCEGENLFGLPHREMSENIVAPLDTVKGIKILSFTKMCKRKLNFLCKFHNPCGYFDKKKNRVFTHIS